jgi:DNA sulfur modification protein DndB
MDEPEILLSAIRGKQAGHDFYLLAIPVKYLVRLLPIGHEAAAGNLHREPDRNRAQEVARYIRENRKSYLIPPLTCSIGRRTRFDAAPRTRASSRTGILRLPFSSELVILEGLHRRVGLELALNADPSLGDESVAIFLYVDPDFQASEQILSDLGRHESRSSRSQGILCDQRDEMARLARELVTRVDVFSDMTEMVRSKISNRSLKLFTLSAIYHATKTLLSARREDSYTDRLEIAAAYWNEVASHIPHWRDAKARKANPAELRKETIHAHGIALAALGRVGRDLLETNPKDWNRRLKALRTLNWSRSNSRIWEGRAMVAGRISKTNVCVMLTGNAIKKHIGLTFNSEEQQAEQRRGLGRN